MAIEVKVPDIGDFKDVPVIEIHVKVGDVDQGRRPAGLAGERQGDHGRAGRPQDGTVEAILVKVGDKVGEGTRGHDPEGGRRRRAGDPAAVGDRPAGAGPRAQADLGPAGAARPGRGRGGRRRPGPCQPERAPARARARGRPGQGQGHRREGPDHQGRRQGVPARPGRTAAGAAAAGGPAGGMGIPEIPAQDFSKFGPIETRPMARIKRISGPFLHRAWLNIPHVTHGDEADITELEAYRKQLDDAAKADKKGPYRVSLLAVPDEGQRLGACAPSPSSTARCRPRRTA